MNKYTIFETDMQQWCQPRSIGHVAVQNKSKLMYNYTISYLLEGCIIEEHIGERKMTYEKH